VLIGTVAAGIPEMTVFWWWAIQSDSSVSMDGFMFTIHAIEALLVGAAAGAICRICWSRAGYPSFYRLVNTLVWSCSGSFVGYFVAGWILGMNAVTSHFLVPLCQGAMMFSAMAYARCGGLSRE
jgi:hypothetical protein